MASSPLNDVQHANFIILSLIRDAARADPGTACCRFGMTLAQLKAISDLPKMISASTDSTAPGER